MPPRDPATLFDLEPRGPGQFAGRCEPGRWQQVFGGHLVAQCLVAAARTVGADEAPYSVQTGFLGRGDTADAIDYVVRVLKEGRAFTVAEVLAEQGGRTLAIATVAWHRREASPAHQEPAPAVPVPDECPPVDLDRIGGPSAVYGHLDVRFVARSEVGADAPWLRQWKRWRHPLPDDALAHASALAWMSDTSMTRVGALPDRDASRPVRHASLDHTLRIHRLVRADRWLLFDEASPVRLAGRALVRGSIFDEDGALVASTDQECLMRAEA